MLETRCPECNQRIKFREEHRGKRLKCPGCATRVDTTAVAAKSHAASPLGMPQSGGMGGGAAVSASGRPMTRKKELKFDDKKMPIWVKTMLIGAAAGFIAGAVWGLMDAAMFSAGLEAQSHNLEAQTGEGLSTGFIVVASLMIALIRGIIFAIGGMVSGWIIGFTGNTLAGTVVLLALAPIMLIMFGIFGIVDLIVFGAVVIPTINQFAD